MSINSVKDHVDSLKLWVPDQRVLKFLEGTCFYPLTQLPHHLKFNHDIPMLAALVEGYDHETGVFEFGSNKVMFSLEDVLYMTGLPVTGLPVSGVDGDYSQVCEHYLGKDGKAHKTGCVRLRWLRDNFEKLPEDVQEGSNQFMWHIRAYVLYIIGSVILPNKSGAFISINLLPLLKHKDDFNKYAWGAALLAHLHKCIKACLDKNSTCVAGHTYSLMLFAIERFPHLALHVMGNKQPSPGDIEDFLNRRPRVFPLIQGWAEELHRTFNNNHHKETKKKYLWILRKHKAEDIIWQPYTRLSPLSRFLPGYLVGQQRMGLSCTFLLCFEIVVHHMPDLCPKQFGLDSVKQLPSLPRKKKEFRRAGHMKDWLSDKRMQPFIATWAKREELLICDVPNDAQDDGQSHEHGVSTSHAPIGLREDQDLPQTSQHDDDHLAEQSDETPTRLSPRQDLTSPHQQDPINETSPGLTPPHQRDRIDETHPETTGLLQVYTRRKSGHVRMEESCDETITTSPVQDYPAKLRRGSRVKKRNMHYDSNIFEKPNLGKKARSKK